MINNLAHLYASTTQTTLSASTLSIAGIIPVKSASIDRIYLSVDSITGTSPAYRVSRYNFASFLPTTYISTLATFIPNAPGLYTLSITPYTPTGPTECIVIEYSSGTISTSNCSVFNRSTSYFNTQVPCVYTGSSGTWTRVTQLPRFGLIYADNTYTTGLHSVPTSDITVATGETLSYSWTQPSAAVICGVEGKLRLMNAASVATIKIIQNTTVLHSIPINQNTVGNNQSQTIFYDFNPITLSKDTQYTIALEVSANSVSVSRETFNSLSVSEIVPGIIASSPYTLPLLSPKIVPTVSASSDAMVFSILS